MKALDLFCGLGGWSDGLAYEGFNVLGIEIEPKIAALYKHDCIIADVKTLDPTQFKGFDLIVGSPPCRDFSILAKTLGHTWKRPPDPKGKGLKLVKAFLDIIEIAKPKYWLMENVPGLAEYLPIKPRVKTRLGKGMIRCFWGNFPSFLIIRDMSKRIATGKGGGLDWSSEGAVYPAKYKSWERAKIPLSISRSLGRAIINARKG